MLHEHGADIEATNNHEMTPIHYTARSNHLEGLKKLAEKGANIHHKDKFNATVSSGTARELSCSLIAHAHPGLGRRLLTLHKKATRIHFTTCSILEQTGCTRAGTTCTRLNARCTSGGTIRTNRRSRKH